MSEIIENDNNENLQAIIQLESREDFLISMRQVLAECSNSVHIGLSAIESLEEKPNEFITSEDEFYSFGPYGPDMNLEKSKEATKNWILNKGFEDLIRAATNPLISLGSFLDLHKKLQDRDNRISFNELRQILFDPKIHHQSSKISFSQLYRKIEPYLKERPQLYPHIYSMQEIRNLLVHRNGMVTKLDVREHEPKKLLWIRPKGVYRDEKSGEIVELKKNTLTNGPGAFGVQFVETSREFSANEHINISFKEFHEMIYTVEFFGQQVVNSFSI